MSNAALEALLRSQRALIAALDADDADAISQSTTEMAEALVRIRAQHGWRPTPELKALAGEAQRLADAARVRVNVLADMTGRRLARLAGLTGRGTVGSTYGRNGRVSL